MKKKLIIVGGANGVGKTTFAYQYKIEYGIDYLGADEIVKELSTNNHKQSDIMAGKEFFHRLNDYLKRSDSVIIESTLSGALLSKWIEKFKIKGYTIHMVFVFLEDVELCKKRVKARVTKGGHNVPDLDIERRFFRSIKNFKKTYLPLADTWQLFYNGLSRPVEVAIGENDNIMIIDEDYYQIFQEICK